MARPDAGDLHLFNEGTHQTLFDFMGAKVTRDGTRFAVWAPSAASVSVIGDWNGWNPGANPLAAVGESGIWAATVPDAVKGARYKYSIALASGARLEKADPYASFAEHPPRTASVVWHSDYAWGDTQWMKERAASNSLEAPMSIYEVHLGSWARVPEDHNRSLTYREMAARLTQHVKDLGFTHVELMPVMEHPFDGSWGYQVTGYFAPTSRFGTPDDFRYLIDTLHQAGIGVILDWVPAHFPTDAHGLGEFDGTHLYEHSDPRQGFHPDWNTWIFNYGRHEVRAFLMSSALYWLGEFHIDGLRVDGVASMIYLDYSRNAGEWIPNADGGRENTAATSFLRQLNGAVYARHPDVQMIAEESTSWPMVTRPASMGGLGFGLKWDMGWMHDTLRYVARDPLYRAHHHHELTFRMVYADTENFTLPLSHDEVVHGKGSLLDRMPGDLWQKFAGLRLLLAEQWAQPGKKLLFMGGEFGQWREWNHDGSLDWHLLDDAKHAGVMRLVRDLNRVYKQHSALSQLDFSSGGFEWKVVDDYLQSAYAWIRKDREGHPVLAAFNFTPVVRYNYEIEVPVSGRWDELLNTDSEVYGGSGVGNLGGATAEDDGRRVRVALTLPPLAAVYLAPAKQAT